MKFKIQSPLIIEFSSPWARNLVFQVLGVIRAAIISTFTFFVATTGGFTYDNALNRGIVSCAKALYHPVYHINRKLPGHFSPFYINAVPAAFRFSERALIYDAQFDLPAISTTSKFIEYLVSPRSVEFRSHLKYSIPIYLILLNLISFSIHFFKEKSRKIIRPSSVTA